MEYQLDQRRLWVALSDVFVGKEPDYQSIARVAKNYAIEDVEFALFERVAPVYIYNGLTPAPPVCWSFDEEELVSDIEFLIERRSRQGGVGKCISTVAGWVIRRWFSNVWIEIKAEIEKANA